MDKRELLGPWLRRFLLSMLFMSGICRTIPNTVTETHLPCCFRSWLNEPKRRWTVYK